MFDKKIKKLLSVAVMLGNMSSLNLLAHRSEKIADEKESLGRKENSSIEIVPDKRFEVIGRTLFYLEVAVISTLAVYCILCNVERKIVVDKYSDDIGTLQKNVNSIKENINSLIAQRDGLSQNVVNISIFDNDINQIEEGILSLEEKKRSSENELSLLNKNRGSICKDLKDVGEATIFLEDASTFLKYNFFVQYEEAKIQRLKENLSPIFEELNKVGYKASFEDFVNNGGYDKFWNYVFDLEFNLLGKLEENKVKVNGKCLNSSDYLEDINFDDLDFSDSGLDKENIENIEKEFQKVKKLDSILCPKVKLYEGIEGLSTIEKVVEEAKSHVKLLEKYKKELEEYLKFEITEEEFKLKVQEFLNLITDKHPDGVYVTKHTLSDLREKLKNYLDKIGTERYDPKNYLSDNIYRDHFEPLFRNFGIKIFDEIERFSEENIKALEEKIKCFGDEIAKKRQLVQENRSTRERLIKENQERKQKISELEEKIEVEKRNFALKEEKLSKLETRKEEITKKEWYELHWLGKFYNSLSSENS